MPRKRRGRPRGSLVAGVAREDQQPTTERLAVGDVYRADHHDPEDSTALRRGYRALSILDLMLKNGEIRDSQWRAGEQFFNEFSAAHLVGVRASDPCRVPVSGIVAGANGSHNAKQSIWRALELLGGLRSAAGSCAWHVLGEGRSLKEWSREIGWNGVGLRSDTAKTILLCTLDALESHYGLNQRTRRAS